MSMVQFGEQMEACVCPTFDHHSCQKLNKITLFIMLSSEYGLRFMSLFCYLQAQFIAFSIVLQTNKLDINPIAFIKFLKICQSIQTKYQTLNHYNLTFSFLKFVFDNGYKFFIRFESKYTYRYKNLRIKAQGLAVQRAI